MIVWLWSRFPKFEEEKKTEGLHRQLWGRTKFRGMGLASCQVSRPSYNEGDMEEGKAPNISERWLDPENHIHQDDEWVPHAQNDKLFSDVLKVSGHIN